MTNYAKGRVKEYECIKQLKKEGYLAVRTAGSHSALDVIAFLQKGVDLPLIRVVQCKASKYVSKKDIKELKDLFLPAIISKELWHFTRGKLKVIDCNG